MFASLLAAFHCCWPSVCSWHFIRVWTHSTGYKLCGWRNEGSRIWIPDNKLVHRARHMKMNETDFIMIYLLLMQEKTEFIIIHYTWYKHNIRDDQVKFMQQLQQNSMVMKMYSCLIVLLQCSRPYKLWYKQPTFKHILQISGYRLKIAACKTMRSWYSLHCKNENQWSMLMETDWRWTTHWVGRWDVVRTNFTLPWDLMIMWLAVMKTCRFIGTLTLQFYKILLSTKAVDAQNCVLDFYLGRTVRFIQ